MTASIKSPLIEFQDTGVYSVRYIASNGSRSDTLTKEVTMLPKIYKNFLGNDTGWCESVGASIPLKAPAGMFCYQWNTGETGDEITTDTAGIYIAKITTPNFCVLYDTINIVIDSIPDKPVITISQDTLKTNAIGNIRYQWYKDEFMTGSNQPYLVYSDSGIYKVEIITSGGCLGISDTVQIRGTRARTLQPNAFVKIFPNPIDNYFYIEVLAKENLKAEIVDITGKKVFDTELSNGLNKIEAGNIENGIYFLKIRFEDESTGIYKLIKTN
ncbi:MAG: T9SS type A sorting domain-containing protein [Bacteroidia bacterium]|nr:T9SS type A sorting domain-containing protein [Bacteroidia bacterium]MCO5254790.1 T9SS type A sorting domain-containing protein [Bacteroidota bacterium]